MTEADIEFFIWFGVYWVSAWLIMTIFWAWMMSWPKPCFKRFMFHLLTGGLFFPYFAPFVSRFCLSTHPPMSRSRTTVRPNPTHATAAWPIATYRA